MLNIIIINNRSSIESVDSIFTKKKIKIRLKSKMVTQEAPGVPSSRGLTKYTATHGSSPSKRNPETSRVIPTH